MYEDLVTFDPRFSPVKVRKFLRYVPDVYREIRKLSGRYVRFPPFVRAMTPKEVHRGLRRGTGRGAYYLSRMDVAVSPVERWKVIFTTWIHELLHHAFPSKSEEKIRDLTGIVVDRIEKRRGRII